MLLIIINIAIAIAIAIAITITITITIVTVVIVIVIIVIIFSIIISVSINIISISIITIIMIRWKKNVQRPLGNNCSAIEAIFEAMIAVMAEWSVRPYGNHSPPDCSDHCDDSSWWIHHDVAQRFVCSRFSQALLDIFLFWSDRGDHLEIGSH